jgi:hypothetical protein
VESIHEAFHDDPTGGLRRLGQILGVSHAHGERFLAQNVLAGLQAAPCPMVVEGVG